MFHEIRPHRYVQQPTWPDLPTMTSVSASWPELCGFGVYLQLFAERAIAFRERGDWIRYNLLVDRWQEFQELAMSTCW